MANYDGAPELQALLVQPAVAVQGQPAKVRWDFVRKTVVLVGLQVLLAIGVATPVLFKCHGLLAAIFHPCRVVVKVATGLVIAVVACQVVHVNYATGSGVWGRGTYIKVMISTPWNLLMMMVYAILMGIVLAFLTWLVSTRTALILAGVYLLVVGSLSVFSTVCSYDLSDVSITLALQLLIALTCGCGAFHFPKGLEIPLLLLWISWFLFFLVQHTQLIFGTSRLREQAKQYTVDMYGYAAFVLFVVYMNLYALPLRLFQAQTWASALEAGVCQSGGAGR